MFLSFDQIDNHNASLIGGKALSLWQLKKAGFNVPKWLVIPADHSAKMCDFMEQLQQYLHEKFPKGSTFAVRSSAIGEDGSEHSFAGMFDTVLAVSIDELPQALEKVYQGLKSERALEYAKQKQLTAPLQLSIVIQRMIHADHSGVAFSQEPISQDASCVSIASIEGLGQLLVDGSESGNQYLVQFEQVIKRFEQPQQHIAQSNAQQSGVQLTALDKPTLISDQQLIQIAQLTQACQAWHGKPQDIEWAIEKGQL